MAAPAPHLAFGAGQVIEVLADDLIEMGEEFGFKFLPSLAVSAGGRHAKDLCQSAEDFVEGVLKSQFMASEDEHGQTRQSQQALAREILWLLAELCNRQRAV